MIGSKPTVVRLRGEQDIATKGALARAIARGAKRDETADVIVDLSAVTFLDASTIGVLVGSRNRFGDCTRAFLLRAPSPQARRLLELCELGDLIEPDVATAPPPTRLAVAADRDGT